MELAIRALRLAVRLAERRALGDPYPDPALLADLGARYALAVVTNGAACLQREKLVRSGLAGHFDAVVVSADVGVGKPDPAVFRRALSLVGAEPADAVMIGDTVARDIDGATALGMRAVWINRFGRPRPREDLVEIRGLDDLPRGVDARHACRGRAKCRHRELLLRDKRVVEVEQQRAGHAGTVEIRP